LFQKNSRLLTHAVWISFASFFQFHMKHHLLVGTWTPPGAIFTFEFDDESLELKMIKRTPIPENEPISWLTIDVSINTPALRGNC
jgi:hypothetical protein